MIVQVARTYSGSLNSASVAQFLTTSWHIGRALRQISWQELPAINEMLLGSGAGSLAWWRVRESPLRDTAAGKELQQAYRFHALQSARDEIKIKEVFQLLRGEGIEPIIVKGWAVARLYPAKGLRPYGDIDLLVRPEQYQRAAHLLRSDPNRKFAVDLEHWETEGASRESIDALYDRSQLVKLDDADIRVLSEEDHLRFICIHLLRHGAWRPLWFCDVAVAVESRSEGFDWQTCLTDNKRQADWVLAAVRLAHELLGADISDTPAESFKLPDWLLPAVMKQWEKPCPQDHRLPAPIRTVLRDPKRIPEAIRARWADPVTASLLVNAPCNNLPRLPFQVATYFYYLAKFFKREAAKR